MCFTIYKAAKRPTRTHAYKVVTLTYKGFVTSYMQNNFYWHCNRSYSIYPRNATSRVGFRRSQRSAAAGFYVYDTLAKARQCYGAQWPESVIMKVTVDPEDWLFSSNPDMGVSTYKKVYVPEEQPYMEWY